MATSARRYMSSVVVATALVAGASRMPAAAPRPPLAGTWHLDLQHSKISGDIGFNPAADAGPGTTEVAGRGRAMPRTTVSPSLRLNQRSEEDYRRSAQLFDEVRNPPGTLTIAVTSDDVNIRGDSGRTRTFHTNGKQEFQELQDAAVATRARWSGTALVIDYTVFEGEDLRYTYSRENDHSSLTVRIALVEKDVKDASPETMLSYAAATGTAR